MALKRISAKNATIAAITDYIIRHQLKAGNPFPTERVLCDEFKVSRIIVREALQYFKTLGIVDSLPSRGATIKSLLPRTPYAGYLPFIRNHTKHIRWLGQLRYIVESGLVPFAMERAGPTALRDLSKIAQSMKRVTDPAVLFERDKQFHSRLWTLCDNELLMSLAHLIIDFFSHCLFLHRYASCPGMTEKTMCAEHMKIVNGIERKDEPALRKILYDHYKDYFPRHDTRHSQKHKEA